MAKKEEEILGDKSIKKPGVSKKIIFLIILVLIILLLYYSRDLILPLIQKNKIMWSFYSHIEFQIKEQTLLGFSYLSFISALFFIIIPMEIFFLYYLSLDHNKFIVLLLLVFPYMLGLVFDYLIGLFLGRKLISKIVGEKYEIFEKIINKLGAFIIIIGHIIFLPMPLITAMLGTARFPFKKFLLLSLIMLFVKYSLLILGSDYIANNIIPLIRSYLPV